MRPLLALLLLVAVASAAPVPKAIKKKDDASLIVGTWKVTALNGQNNGTFHTHTFVFDAEGGVRTVYSGDQTTDWTWALVAGDAPKRMRWVAKTKGQTDFDCVYELDGDTLKFGFITSGQKPPAKVEPGPGLTLYELTRDPAGK